MRIGVTTNEMGKRYGFVSKRRKASLGDTGTPGAMLDAEERPRQGELPARRGSRKRPPCGTKSDATRVIPVLDRVGALQSDSDQRKERLRLSYGRGAARDAGRDRESRRQGETVTKDLLAGIEEAATMATRAELLVVKEVFLQKKRVDGADVALLRLRR
jgi:hypothetical protein